MSQYFSRINQFFRDALKRKRRYLGRYFAHPMMQNRRAKRDDYKPSAVRVTQRCVP
ncbi:phosphatase [Piscirickettsia salmonis EM-90]|nr:phosphatase [Piscirickettsia salmonis EM-90]